MRLVFFGLRLVLGSCVLAIMLVLAVPRQAGAVPSFAEQTGQPCAACHVGAFGPQLKQPGRDFKLFGYVSSDGKDHFPPIAATVQTSFTKTNVDQPGGAARGFGPNSNFAVDQVSLYYAGRITSTVGGFIQGTYDGVAKQFAWDNLDIRHAREGTLLGSDMVYGVTVNNGPTIQDVWNSTPAWGFPYDSSKLAPSPAATALIDGGLSQAVLGAGAYMMWNDWVFVEFDLYRGLGRNVRNALGVVPVSGSDTVDGFVPYWRLALQHEFGNHYVQIGTYGLSAAIVPGGDVTAGTSDRYVDVAFDANYQWLADPLKAASDMVSAHATYIRQRSSLDASQVLLGTNASNSLSVFRADVSYSIAATVTPSVQYFQTRGTSDAALFTASANGSPNSAGWIGELAYVPFGKPDSIIDWGNLRVSVQYVAYTEFNGTADHASDNNSLYFNLWLAWRF
jgi:hypothetical protein